MAALLLGADDRRGGACGAVGGYRAVNAELFPPKGACVRVCVRKKEGWRGAEHGKSEK